MAKYFWAGVLVILTFQVSATELCNFGELELEEEQDWLARLDSEFINEINDIKEVLRDDGIFVSQLMTLVPMLEKYGNKAGYKKGDVAGKLNKTNKYYFISIDNESYMAHRIVYYLRTGKSPDYHSVQHTFSNRNKDNRLELRATYIPRMRKFQNVANLYTGYNGCYKTA